MARSYKCDGPDCTEQMDEAGIEVTYYVDASFGVEDEDSDDDFELAEAHFCGFSCMSAWAFTKAAQDNPNL
jgi:hypothetical protein